MSSTSPARPKSDLEKPLPQNLDAERCILAAVLLDNSYLAKAADILHSGDFFLGQHETIFRTMLAMVEAGQPVDLVPLIEKMQSNGTLATAGGAPYISGLTDGMPRITNVEHYAGIVREKSRLRQIVHVTHGFQQRALAGGEDNNATSIMADLGEWMKMSENGGARKDKLVAVDLLDFLQLELDPIDFIIEPILPVANSAMVWSLAGAGKTYIMLKLAYCVAAGVPDCFVWNIPSARPVVYVDGEMDQQTLQERQREIWRGMIAESGPAAVPAKGMFKIITPDQQPKFPPRINTKEGRARIEEHLQENCMVVLDNISTLSPGADEKETEDWAPVQEWILYLRRKRVATFLVHHGNASGQKQLGSSKKEHQLSCNLQLRTSSEWTPEHGLLVEARLQKLRRRGVGNRWSPAWGQPFEIALRVDKENNTDASGAAHFTHRPMMTILKKRAIEMLLAGMRENDVAAETGLNRFVVYRLAKKVKSDGVAAAESE